MDYLFFPGFLCLFFFRDSFVEVVCVVSFEETLAAATAFPRFFCELGAFFFVVSDVALLLVAGLGEDG